MKFQKLEPFEAHFKESFPKHLAPVFAIVCPKEQERKKVSYSIAKTFEKETDYKKCSTIKEALQHLQSQSLFSGKVAAFFDGAETLLKEEVELLKLYIASPNPQGHLLLGSSAAKNISELYKKGKKVMVILDLTAEKPWEEKQRIKTWAFQVVQANKKQITPDALETLLNQLPPDRLLLSQELEKLFCYVGSRKTIEKADIQAISSSSKEHNIFQIAQTLVFGNLPQIPPIHDISTLLPLIFQLRNQFEMGLKMCALLQKGTNREEIGKEFPRLWPKALQTALDGANRKKTPFFKRGLLSLYDLEFGLKTSLGKPHILFAKFCGEVL